MDFPRNFQNAKENAYSKFVETTKLTVPQSITWLRTCESGLIHQKQNIIINSHVYQTGPNGTMDRAQFEIKTVDSQTSTCYLDLTQCSGYKYSYCYCQPTNVQHVLHAVINITATTSLSRATVKGTVYNLHSRVASEELAMPIIYDPSTIEMIVHINTAEINVNNCTTVISQSVAIIVLLIPDNIKLQYETVLQELDSSKTLKSGSNLLIYSRHVSDSFSFRVSYHVIQDVGSKRSFNCTLRVEPKDKDKTEHTELLIIIPTICIATGILGILVFCILYQRLKIGRFTLKKSTVQVRDKQIKKVKKRELEIEEPLSTDYNEMHPIVNVQEEKHKLISNDENQKFTSIPDTIMSLIQDIENIEDTDTKKIKDKDHFSASKKSQGPPYAKSAFLHDLVQSQLEIMVKVEASFTSDRRPEKWPGRVVKYPFHQKEARHQKRAGIGRIVQVKKFDTYNRTKSRVWRTEDASCRTSEHSMSQWMEIQVYVARHVVFDDSEAKHTTCTLLMNIGGKIGTMFKGKLVRTANVGENWIILTCVSEDVGVFESLHQKMMIFNKEWENINASYTHFSSINNIGFIVTPPEIEPRGSKFERLLDFFKKERYHKTLNYTLNTIFEMQKTAIYLERTSESILCNYQKEGRLNLVSVSDADKFELGSLPLIIKLM